MPRLFDLIESYLRGESVRKAAVFTPEELMQFWKEASSKNTFWLVRKIASSLAFLGGNRLAELRRAKQSAIYNSPIGENTLRKIGQDIANWLGLENADKYTGHTFRR